MTRFRPSLRLLPALVLGALLAAPAMADDAAIRKNWAEANPGTPPIDEISKTPIAGLYEVRVGTEIFYVDEKGEHVIFASEGSRAEQGTGHIISLKAKKDITQARIDKLTAIDVDKLPFQDAMVMKQGTGARRLVIFEDPNCTYCKRLERDLVALKDVTIYTFLIPILGPDSTIKARDIWCSRDNSKVWRNWMLNGEPVKREMGKCDAGALDRNLALAQRYRINGTPAIVFDDGSHVPGAIPLAELEKSLMTKVKKG